MKLTFATLLMLALIATTFADDNKKTEIKDPKDRTSYSIGVNIASGLKRDKLDLNPDMVAAAIKDVLSGKEPLMSEKEVTDTILALQKEMTAKMQEQFTQLSEKNKKEGEAFLAENKKKEGVVTTATGLQYKILKVGDGKKPKATDTITAHYRGTLIDGTEFDSSHKRGEPAQFPVRGVISGWTEALQLMPVGSKWQLVIPANLAYGERGTPGGPIGPNTTLVFEVELLSIDEASR